MHARGRWRTRCRRRARFIRRLYAHLAYAVLGFLVLEYTLLNLPGVEHIVALMTNRRMLVLRPAQEDRGYHQTPIPKSKTPESTSLQTTVEMFFAFVPSPPRTVSQVTLAPFLRDLRPRSTDHGAV